MPPANPRRKRIWIGSIVAAVVVIVVIVAVSIGSSGGSKSPANAAQNGATDSAGGNPSAAALIKTCIADYNAGDFGAISNSDSSSDPSPYCNCVIPSWLSSGDSAQKIAAAMKSDSTGEFRGAAPLGFSQQPCIDKDPTINPKTGIPY